MLSADEKVSGLLAYYVFLVCLFGFETALHVSQAVLILYVAEAGFELLILLLLFL